MRPGNNIKKEALILIAVILLSSLAFAATLYVKANISPKIELTFTEYVIINSINLTKDGRIYPLTAVATGDTVEKNGIIYSDEYVAEPIQPLMNGEYLLLISAKDLVDNYIRRNETIIVDVSYMWIKITNPKFFTSPTKVFDLEITTEKPASDCRYAYLDVGFENAIFEMDDTGTIHTKKSFNSDNFLPDPEIEKKIYVYCLADDERIHPRTLNISYDTSAPDISASADPTVIVEKIDGRMISKLKVVSDDKIVCDYTVPVKKLNTNCTFVPSSTIKPFDNYPQDDPYSYITNPVQQIDVTDLVGRNITGCTFSYNISCKNAAGFKSRNLTIPIVLNLIAPVGITKISPKDVSKNTSVFLNFTTSKIAECAYVIGDLSGKLDTKDRRKHTKDLGEFEEGKYDIKISCSSAEGTNSADFTFIIDLSPPLAPKIKAPSAVCTKSISAELSGEDLLSGIAGFNYTLESLSGILASGFASGNPAKIQISGLNFTHNQIYTVKAKAKDKVGFWSVQGIGNSTIYDETGVRCDTTPPLIYLAKNRTAQGYVVYIECIDMQTSCNNNSFTFSFSNNRTCSGFPGPLYYSSEYRGFAKLVPSTTYFCFEASDIAGNKASGHEYILINELDHCADEVKDNDETDIDCGGLTTCQRCLVGQVCLADSDCQSQFCDASGFCKDVACDDTIKNGFETDVDCGGTFCNPCNVSQSCLYNTDCITNFCLNDTCAVPTCNDTYENGVETDIDCGGNCPLKCANGGKCKVDSDCISGYCSGMGSYKLCAQMAEEVIEEAKKKIPVAKTTFISLGLLSILSSLGYLSYLRFMPKKPITPARAPPKPPAKPAAPTPPPVPPARAPSARRESDWERLEKIRGTSKLERLGRGKSEEALERLGKSEFEKLENIRKGTKLERLGRGKSERAIEKLKPKKKNKRAIESLRK